MISSTIVVVDGVEGDVLCVAWEVGRVVRQGNGNGREVGGRERRVDLYCFVRGTRKRSWGKGVEEKVGVGRGAPRVEGREGGEKGK